MNTGDRVKRAIVFYFSVGMFFVLLPIVLSYSLGYKIDYVSFKIYKTGIIYVNSRPAGASIFVNGKEHPELTPAQIEKLKPGMYRVEVRRDGFYPWERELEVMPNMVTKADRIVLFPLTQEITKVAEREAHDFIITGSHGTVYYMTGSGLFRSNVDGSGMRMISSYHAWPGKITGKKLSPDGNKILYFNEKSVSVIYLNSGILTALNGERARVSEIYTSADPIIDVFWYSDSGYLTVVTGRDIKIVELLDVSGQNVVSLHKFSIKPQNVHYDENSDSIYFIDKVKDGAGRESAGLYRIDLREKFFDQLMKILIKRQAEDRHGKG